MNVVNTVATNRCGSERYGAESNILRLQLFMTTNGMVIGEP
jgi:hypothetical protein